MSSLNVGGEGNTSSSPVLTYGETSDGFCGRITLAARVPLSIFLGAFGSDSSRRFVSLARYSNWVSCSGSHPLHSGSVSPARCLRGAAPAQCAMARTSSSEIPRLWKSDTSLLKSVFRITKAKLFRKVSLFLL